MPIDWGNRETTFRLLAAAFAVIGKEGVSSNASSPHSIILMNYEHAPVLLGFSGKCTDHLASLEVHMERLQGSSASLQRTMLYSVSFEKSRRWPKFSVADELARTPHKNRKERQSQCDVLLVCRKTLIPEIVK